MTNTTTEYWDVDGQSLQTFAFNIESVGGDRLAPPPLRGDNLLIPSTVGRRRLPKIADSRTIELGMWVIGAEEDGSAPTGTNRAKFDENFRMLRSLLWQEGREFTLTKRFYVDGVLKTASAQAEYAGGLNPTMMGRTRGVFSVNLELADPYFYSALVNTNLATGTQTVTVEGDATTTAILLHVDGPRNNVKIRNNTLGIDVEYHADLSTGDDWDADVKAYTSVTDPVSADPFNSIGSIRHTGAAQWLALAPGDNEIVVSSDSGIGLVVLSHQAAWL